jgi:mono/diheme cytochrome c family protein
MKMSSGIKYFRRTATLALASGLLGWRLVPAPVGAASPGAAASAQAAPAAAGGPGASSYAEHCAICHGEQREGILPAFPPLLGIEHQLSDDQIAQVIHQGKGRMPGFPALQNDELKGLLSYLGSGDELASMPAAGGPMTPNSKGLVDAGHVLFQQNCAFCHGRDTMGGETGPDLTQSKVVQADVNGDRISEVVLNGRPAKKMPAFRFSAPELQGLAAFIHAQQAIAAASSKGGRKGVEVADLQTGHVEAGKRYFNGAGNCAKCHSPSGDLAGIASRFQGLRLEMRMLYPEGAKDKVTVTLPSGKKFEGTLAYLDEFNVALREADGTYRSWATSRVKYAVDSPVEAHADQFPKYTDDDIHNLMAYLQTLR